MIHPVILCGGSGTRLWPVSRKAHPKQFVPLIGEETLYQSTLRRFTGEAFDAPLILTGDEFRFMAVEQATAIGLADPTVLVEPMGRDTAPAILTAALYHEDSRDDVLVIAPSDHVIEDISRFQSVIREAAKAAQDGALVTLGIKPDRPETAYGYLELEPGDGSVRALKSFREKPDAETAASMLAAGNFLWNAGIFVFTVGAILDAFEAHAADMIGPCREALKGGREDLSFFRLGEAAYREVRAQSFDYAIMEKAERVACVPFDAGWNDLGAWDAVYAASLPGNDGVAQMGDTLAIDCSDTLLRSEEPGMQLVGLGLDGVMAVAMRDAVLVADKSRAQDVKAVVDSLRKADVPQADHYPRFHRPWGWYETLCIDTRFQVKRIMVKPGGILSLQSHMHRSEHWIVVVGTAEVTVGDDTRMVTENEGVYIPLGTVHRMANPGKVPMYLIEVQTGAYLGEDDIIRYEDVYNRA